MVKSSIIAKENGRGEKLGKRRKKTAICRYFWGEIRPSGLSSTRKSTDETHPTLPHPFPPESISRGSRPIRVLWLSILCIVMGLAYLYEAQRAHRPMMEVTGWGKNVTKIDTATV